MNDVINQSGYAFNRKRRILRPQSVRLTVGLMILSVPVSLLREVGKEQNEKKKSQ